MLLARDHGGPGQGSSMDDGVASYTTDSEYFDIIHIDPWKKASSLEDGTRQTIEGMKLCFEKNPNILFEIGTEESIRPFSSKELRIFIFSFPY